jgi:hypothetical protein
VPSHVFTFEVVTFFVNLRLSADHDARNAETTLQTPTRGECIGILFTFFVAYPFECHDLSACDFVQTGLTANHGFAID